MNDCRDEVEMAFDDVDEENLGRAFAQEDDDASDTLNTSHSSS